MQDSEIKGENAWLIGYAKALEYLFKLSLGALNQTHHLDDRLKCRLFDTVVDLYTKEKFAESASSRTPTVDIATCRIDLILRAHSELAMIKH